MSSDIKDLFGTGFLRLPDPVFFHVVQNKDLLKRRGRVFMAILYLTLRRHRIESAISGSEITKITGVKRGYVFPLLQDLEKDGLIEINKSTGRKNIIKLSPYIYEINEDSTRLENTVGFSPGPDSKIQSGVPDSKIQSGLAPDPTQKRRPVSGPSLEKDTRVKEIEGEDNNFFDNDFNMFLTSNQRKKLTALKKTSPESFAAAFDGFTRYFEDITARAYVLGNTINNFFTYFHVFKSPQQLDAKIESERQAYRKNQVNSGQPVYSHHQGMSPQEQAAYFTGSTNDAEKETGNE